MSVSYFFYEMPADVLSKHSDQRNAKVADHSEMGEDPLIRRETLELGRAYYKIRNTQVRKRIRDMILGLSSMGEKDAHTT